MKQPNGMFLTVDQSARLLAMSPEDRKKAIEMYVAKIRKLSGGKQARRICPKDWHK